MAIKIHTSFVVIDFTKDGNGQAAELDARLNEGWTVHETYQFDTGIVYELRKYETV